MSGSPRIVGERTAGVDYRLRPSAYGIVFDATGRVGLVWTGRLYFLPGGGAEPDEAPEATVVRETLEETGHEITLLEPLPQVIEFFQSREDGLHYEVCGTYFLGRLGKKVADPIEPHHELHWFSPAEALDRLHRPGQVEALRNVLETRK